MTDSSLAGRRVMVTGGAGFLGSHLAPLLAARGAEIFVPRSREFDLRKSADVRRALDDGRPEVIIHLAAVVGGIGANRSHPGQFFYDNAIMGIELMEQARHAGVRKFVTIGTVCSYPKFAQVPFREEAIWDGYPEETNAPYGLAKKALLVQGQAYRAEYGFNVIHLLPTNLYGPGDGIDPHASHVVPALIRKCVDAQESGAMTVPAWGTGSASREFLFVADAAEAIVRASESYDGGEPINLGGGGEITVRDLSALIAKVVGWPGEFAWDSNQPDGQPRRALDVTRARRELGFEATTTLEDGLRQTVAWYRDLRRRGLPGHS